MFLSCKHLNSSQGHETGLQSHSSRKWTSAALSKRTICMYMAVKQAGPVGNILPFCKGAWIGCHWHKPWEGGSEAKGADLQVRSQDTFTFHIPVSKLLRGAMNDTREQSWFETENSQGRVDTEMLTWCPGWSTTDGTAEFCCPSERETEHSYSLSLLNPKHCCIPVWIHNFDQGIEAKWVARLSCHVYLWLPLTETGVLCAFKKHIPQQLSPIFIKTAQKKQILKDWRIIWKHLQGKKKRKKKPLGIYKHNHCYSPPILQN